METKLIVMLTANDQTLTNAGKLFDSCSDLDVECWGFKALGISHNEMKELVGSMKAAGKTTFLEIVSYTEEACMIGAQKAVEFGFDYLMGTIFYENVCTFIKKNKLKYLPFVGNVHGNPSILEGDISDIIEEGKALEKIGVNGFDILAYRHISDPEGLIQRFSKEINLPVVIAGSINSIERINLMKKTGVWGFTIGSALVSADFVSGSFRDNLKFVIKHMSD